jgi:hypothetical protein
LLDARSDKASIALSAIQEKRNGKESDSLADVNPFQFQRSCAGYKKAQSPEFF